MVGVDLEKCILGWVGLLVIFYFIKCFNVFLVICLYMCDFMDIFCKKMLYSRGNWVRNISLI